MSMKKLKNLSKERLIIALLLLLLTMVSTSYWNYYAKIIGDQGTVYPSRRVLCDHLARSYLKTIQKEIDKKVDEYESKKWEMAIDVETDLYNLCTTELTEESLSAFALSGLKKYAKKEKGVSIIQSFTNNSANDLQLTSAETDRYNQHSIEQYVDSNGVEYSVDVNDGEIIFYNTFPSTKKFATSKPKISINQAKSIGMEFLKRNYSKFESFIRDSEFIETDGKDSKVNVYSFSWNKKVSDIPYQVSVVVDKYGNVVHLQREYMSEQIQYQNGSK